MINRMVYYTKFIILILILFFSVPLKSQLHAGQEGKKWSPRLTLEFRPDHERSLGRFDLLVPVWQTENSVLFSDLRYINTSGPGMEGNLGLGYRRLGSDLLFFGGEWIGGTYAFFDRRKTPLDNYFSQLTTGAELFTDRTAFRVNGYFPDKTGDVISIGGPVLTTSGLSLSGTTVVSDTSGSQVVTKEWALPGFDVEAGIRIETLPNHDLWLYGGYFYFDRQETVKIEGPRVRLEYQMRELFGWTGSQLTLGAEMRDDDVNGTDGVVLARFSIPLGSGGKKALTGLERRMTEFVQRDVDVVTLIDDDEIQSAGSPIVIIDPVSGEIINVYVVSNDGTGDCTQGNPCTVAVAQSDSNYGSGDVIILTDQSGNVVSDVDLTTTVGGLGADRRQLLGGSDNLVINLSSGDDLNLTGLGGRPTLEGAVTLGNESIVRGFDILSPNHGITGNGINSATIQDVRVLGAGGHGLSLSNVSGNVDVTDFSVDQAAGNGIFLNSNTGEIIFGNTGVSNSGQGIVIENNSGNVVFGDTGISNVEHGIVVDNSAGNLSFGNVGVTNPSGTGIDLSGASGNVTFNEVDITGLGSGTGLNLNGSSARVSMNTLDISGTGTTGSTGVDLRGATGALVVAQGGTVQNVVTGFDFNANSNATVDFQNGRIDAGVPVNTVGVTNGSYNLTGNTFVKDNTLSTETGFGVDFLFVDATGDGPGTPDNPTSADLAEGNSSPGDIIFLVEEGAGPIVASGGFLLQENQQLIGFASGDTSVDFTGVNPQFLGTFEYAVSDPTGLGGATLTNSGGSEVLTLTSGVNVRDFSIRTTGTADGISGNGFSGAQISGMNVSDTGGRAISLTNARGEIRVSDSIFTRSGKEALAIVGGDADIHFIRSEISNSALGNAFIRIEGTTGGSVTFDADSVINNAGGNGIFIDNIAGDIAFNGPVHISTPLNRGNFNGNGVTATHLGTSTLSFNNGLFITTQSGSGLVISGGNVFVAGGSIDATGGHGIQATDSTIDIKLDHLSASAGFKDLDLTNVNSTVDIGP